jgi:BirA family biotin operon repressor/biotin-[acetyl-CoA-carboxylase] ligase
LTDAPLDRWEGVPAPELARQWEVPEVHLFESIGSTSDLARRLAAGGAPAGTLVLAERQMAGRGRAGRAWDSPPGLGLWFSLVIRPRDLPRPGALPLLVGLAVAEALDPFVRPAAVALKWPNDLLSGGRKLGGILCEGAWERERPSFLVAGIGLNLLHSPGDFPEELRDAATSVRIAAGWSPPRLEVAGAVVRRVLEVARGPLELTTERLAALAARDALRGREIAVTEPTTGEPLAEGTALGVSPEGALLLRTRAGAIRPVHSGTARPIRSG